MPARHLNDLSSIAIPIHLNLSSNGLITGNTAKPLHFTRTIPPKVNIRYYRLHIYDLRRYQPITFRRT